MDSLSLSKQTSANELWVNRSRDSLAKIRLSRCAISIFIERVLSDTGAVGRTFNPIFRT
jgi:hypothetical protein